MVPPPSHGISRAPRYSGFCSPAWIFTYRTLTFSGQPSHAVQLTLADAKCSPYPGRIAPPGLAFSPFARHYSGNLGWFLFLVLLRCFSSDGSPRKLILLGLRCMDLTPCGLLHSDICGSIRACRSPQLFAAYRVLLRLLMPRHPSCALISLTYLFRIMVSSLGHIFRCFPTEEFLRNCIYPFNLSLKLDIYFCFKIVSSLLFRYSIFKELSPLLKPFKSLQWYLIIYETGP